MSKTEDTKAECVACTALRAAIPAEYRHTYKGRCTSHEAADGWILGKDGPALEIPRGKLCGIHAKEAEKGGAKVERIPPYLEALPMPILG